MRLVISIIFSFILISCGQTTSGVDPVQTQKRIDKQQQLENIMKKKLEMELAHEAAIVAKEDKIKENYKNAEEIKEQVKNLIFSC